MNIRTIGRLGFWGRVCRRVLESTYTLVFGTVLTMFSFLYIYMMRNMGYKPGPSIWGAILLFAGPLLVIVWTIPQMALIGARMVSLMVKAERARLEKGDGKEKRERRRGGKYKNC